MAVLAQREKCTFWQLLHPMCHWLDNSLSSPPFTVISTSPAPVIHQSCGGVKEYEIKKREGRGGVYIHVLISFLWGRNGNEQLFTTTLLKFHNLFSLFYLMSLTVGYGITIKLDQIMGQPTKNSTKLTQWVKYAE